jgi:hypothetical protein
MQQTPAAGRSFMVSSWPAPGEEEDRSIWYDHTGGYSYIYRR